MKLTTQIVKDFSLKNILGKGTFSVVTQHTGMSALKHTACQLSSAFIESHKEDQTKEPYFISGYYTASQYVGDYMVSVYEVPLLKPFHIKDLSAYQKRFVRKWKAYTRQVHHRHTRDVYAQKYNDYQQQALDLIDEYFGEYEEAFLINLKNLIYSFDMDSRLDVKFKDSILLNEKDELVISDPVFSHNFLQKLRKNGNV